jgi:hypothetical protein
MSLLRLLSAGKSLVGIQAAETRYRLTEHRMLPKFGGKKNPFRRTEGPADGGNPNFEFRNPKIEVQPEAVMRVDVGSFQATETVGEVKTIEFRSEQVKRELAPGEVGPKGTQRIPVVQTSPAAGSLKSEAGKWSNAIWLNVRQQVLRLVQWFRGFVAKWFIEIPITYTARRTSQAGANAAGSGWIIQGASADKSQERRIAEDDSNGTQKAVECPATLQTLVPNPLGGGEQPGESRPACSENLPMRPEAKVHEGELSFGKKLAQELSGLFGFATRSVPGVLSRFKRSPSARKSAVPQFSKSPVQGELSLDQVKVMRNDLSDADLEVVSTKKDGNKPESRGPKAENGSSKPEIRTPNRDQIAEKMEAPGSDAQFESSGLPDNGQNTRTLVERMSEQLMGAGKF